MFEGVSLLLESITSEVLDLYDKEVLQIQPLFGGLLHLMLTWVIEKVSVVQFVSFF